MVEWVCNRRKGIGLTKEGIKEMTEGIQKLIDKSIEEAEKRVQEAEQRTKEVKKNTLLEAVKNLMKNAGMSAEEAMENIGIPQGQRETYAALI